MKTIYAILSCALMLLMGSCVHRSKSEDYAATHTPDIEAISAFRDSLTAIAASAPGEVGIAVIVNGSDTIVVNDSDIYPLMSVFKLHQAVALCHEFDTRGISIDTMIDIDRSTLSPDTWSPMLKDYTQSRFSMSARELMRYTLTSSDNNASNLMFDRFINVAKTDSFIATLIPRDRFRLSVKEADMQCDHSLSYANHSSPSATAILLDRLFTDSILSPQSQNFICDALKHCATGNDRISAPLVGKTGVTIAHKTGSGYINERDELVAHNDAAIVTLPDGRHYTIVVFVKDFRGDEQSASSIISRISSVTYDFINQPRCK